MDIIFYKNESNILNLNTCLDTTGFNLENVPIFLVEIIVKASYIWIDMSTRIPV